MTRFRRIAMAMGVISAVLLGSSTFTADATPPSSHVIAESTSFSSGIAAQFAIVASFEDNIAGKFAAAESRSIVPLAAPLCRATMDWPHVSDKGKRVVGKARFVCDANAPGTDIDAILTMWVCSKKLPSNYSPNTPTAAYGCVEKASAHYPVFGMSAGSKTTRYVPLNAGETSGGVQGSGYWPACVGYKRNGGATNYACSTESPPLTA